MTSRPEIVPVRHWGQWLGAIVVVAAIALGVDLVVSARTLHFSIVGHYLFNNAILSGVLVTLELTVLSMLIGVLAGIVLAVMRLSRNYVLRSVAGLYIWFFRGTPLLVQLIFWFNIALFIPHVHLGPLSLQTNALVTTFVASLLGLALNEAAYMAEIVRAGIISVDKAQTDAAYSLGYTPWLTMRTIILPQAMRVIVPPTGNETIGMLKTTSLVVVVGGDDLLTRAQNIASANFALIELLIVASLWYLAMTTLASIGQAFLEAHFSQGIGSSPGGIVKAAWARARALPRHGTVDSGAAHV